MTNSRARLRRLREDFGDRAYFALTLRRRPNDRSGFRARRHWRQLRVPTVATNDVLYHVPGRRILQDVVTCIREGCTIDDAGFRRERFADRYLKPPAEMAPPVRAATRALARTRGDCRALPLFARRTRLPISRRDRGPGPYAAGDPGEADLGGRGRRYPEACPDKVAAQIRA